MTSCLRDIVGCFIHDIFNEVMHLYIFHHWSTNRVQVIMMTPWHGINLRIPVPLWEESISNQRYPLHRRLESSGCNHKPVQYVKTAPVMRGAMILMGACVTSLKCVDIMAPITYILGSLLLSGLTLISAWIINHIPVKCRVKLLKHSQTSMVYGVTIEGWEWIINFIPHIIAICHYSFHSVFMIHSCMVCNQRWATSGGFELLVCRVVFNNCKNNGELFNAGYMKFGQICCSLFGCCHQNVIG